ncbi:hypothetical protein HID58_043058, partial [Brassica napus]
ANGGPKISSVNGVWIEKTLPIDSSFKDLCFRSRRLPIKDHTNGLIKDLLPHGSISSLTNCVYGNALYFKGAWQVLRIPYRQGDDEDQSQLLLSTRPFRFSMYFYLPDKNDGLEDLVKTMASTSGFLNCHTPRCKVLNPKFKIAYGLDGQDLGLRSMVLYHKACVKIDEEGAEAAAVTFAYSDGCSMYLEPPKRIDFVADHPYLFLIREDKTGTVLF